MTKVPIEPTDSDSVRQALEHLPADEKGMVDEAQVQKEASIQEVRDLIRNLRVPDIVEHLDEYIEECGIEEFLTVFLDTDDKEVRYGRMRMLQSRIGDKIDPEVFEKFLSPEAEKPVDSGKVSEPIQIDPDIKAQYELGVEPKPVQRVVDIPTKAEPIVLRGESAQDRIDSRMAYIEAMTEGSQEVQALDLAREMINKGEGEAFRHNIDKFLEFIDPETLLTLMLRGNLTDAMATEKVKDKFDEELYDRMVKTHFPALLDNKPSFGTYH